MRITVLIMKDLLLVNISLHLHYKTHRQTSEVDGKKKTTKKI